MLTIALLQQKGGVGKTTLATNLAAGMHLAGKRTLLIDMDPQASAFDWYSARLDGSKLDGLVVVKADRPLSSKKFDDMTRDYDVVVCDGPATARAREVSQAAALVADVVIIPVRPGALDLWATNDTLALLVQSNELRAVMGRPPVRVLFVLNAAVKGSRLTIESYEAIEQMIADSGDMLGHCAERASVMVHQRVDFPTAMHEGLAALAYSPPSLVPKKGLRPAAQEISGLLDHVLAMASRKDQAA